MDIKPIMFQFIKEYGTETSLALAIGVDFRKLRGIIKKEIMPCEKTLLFLALKGINIGLLLANYKEFQTKYAVKKHYSRWGTYVWRLDKLNSTTGITYDEFLKLRVPKFIVTKRAHTEMRSMIVHAGTARSAARKMRDLKLSLKLEERESIVLQQIVLTNDKHVYMVEEVIIPPVNSLL